MKQQAPHPILPEITPAQAMAMGPDGFIAAFNRREELIARERHDPLRYGWEPPIWKVADALLGLDKFGFVDAEWAQRMRAFLGYERPVSLLLINGGNRAGKSEYCGKRMMMVMMKLDKARTWMFHSSSQNSVEYQHSMMWRYMPPELKRAIRSEVTYITYNQKNGFTENKFVLPNGSECSFRNYEQDIQKIEGGEVDAAWASELVPPEWVDTLKARVATRGGFIPVDFTPIDGYTPTVKIFRDGARTVRECVAFLEPNDGGEARPDLAFQVEDVDKWLTGEPSQPEIPAGRSFVRVPRVERCVDDAKAVIYFHSMDNPYGGGRNLWDMYRGEQSQETRIMRMYGVAAKQAAARLTRFNPDVHVLPDAAIPEAGTNILVVDPASARNFFMIWVRFTPEGTYVYREWPGYYPIPGVGIPGAWAIPDGRKMDGKPGPAAKSSFGFGLVQYKAEIARLERWRDAQKKDENGGRKSEEEIVRGWDESNGADEVVYQRFMDSRFASAVKVENDRPVTLLEQFTDLGLLFDPTPGDDVSEGVRMIENLLYYDTTRPVDFFNRPKLYVAESCKNTIFAMQTWTGADGQKGATTDPIACLRYAVLSGVEYVGDRMAVEDDDERSGW
jgi:hypothetical protein